MKDYRKFLKDKKITVMGLGLLGRGVGDALFLAECGAKLTITDLKTKAELNKSLQKLKKFKDIKYVLGKHRLEDFRNADIILKAAGVPLDSPYIKEAKKNKIPVEMDVSLFTKLAPEVKIVGITGTRGKSMTTALVYEILKQNEKFIGRRVYIGGNVKGLATLPLLKKAKRGDVLVCELDSWQLQGFGDSKISPHIAVFTSFLSDHMNYYKNDTGDYFSDKANIFKYQKKGDLLIIRPDVKKLIPKKLKNRLVVVNAKDADKYSSTLPGKFQKENLACALAVAKEFHIPASNIAKAIKNFKGLEGRLQYLKTVKEVKIYNDNNATTPEATMAGIEALSINLKKKKIILICGGSDKGLNLNSFIKVINIYCKAVVTIPGTGTDRLLGLHIQTENYKTNNLKEAVKKALSLASKGEIVLFSPAFASFGMFNNEYERNDLFMKIAKTLK